MFSLDVFFNAVLALLSIVNPITVIPMFSELGGQLEKPDRNRLYNIAVLAAFVTLLILTFSGRWIMEYVFHINVAEFRIAGGILLTVIAVKQIAFYKHEDHAHDKSGIMELGIVPLGFPMLVGPGSIVTSILILDRDGWLVAILAWASVFLLTWIIVRSSHVLARLMGRYGTLVLARVLWIFIAAIAVRFLVSGIAEVFGLVIKV